MRYQRIAEGPAFPAALSYVSDSVNANRRSCAGQGDLAEIFMRYWKFDVPARTPAFTGRTSNSRNSKLQRSFHVISGMRAFIASRRHSVTARSQSSPMKAGRAKVLLR